MKVAAYFSHPCELLSQQQRERLRAKVLHEGTIGANIQTCDVLMEGTRTVVSIEVDLFQKIFRDVYEHSDEIAIFEPMRLGERHAVRYDSNFRTPRNCQLAIGVSDTSDESLQVVGDVNATQHPELDKCAETIDVAEAVIYTLDR